LIAWQNLLMSWMLSESTMSRSWNLKVGDEILGVLTRGSLDTPFVFCEFVANSPFSKYQAMFAKELALLNSDQMAPWEQAYSEIDALGLVLEPNDATSELITEFILHIDGNKAWFRS